MPPVLEALPTVTLEGVELCRTGRWNGIDYTPAELKSVLDNYKQLHGVWSIPLTLGHDGESQLGDGAPALGWVSNLRLEGESLYGDYVKVPKQLAQLIQSGAYAKRSCTFLVDPEIDGQQRRGLVLQNVALLGAQQPAVDGLEDVFALYNRRRLAWQASHGRRVLATYDVAADATKLTNAGNIDALLDYWSEHGDWDDCIDAVTGKVDDPEKVCGWIKAQVSSRELGAAERVALRRRTKTVNLALMLARLPLPVRAAYDAWKAAHPTAYQLISGPPMSDIQSAVEKALAGQYPPAEGESDDDAPGADGPSCNVLDWFVSGQDMSVIVSDQDVDNLFEIPFTYDAGTDTATLSSPIPVKGTYTRNTTGSESGGGGTDEEGNAGAAGGATGGVAGGAAGVPAADSGSGGGEAQQMTRLLGQYAALHTLSRSAGLDPDVDALLDPVSSAVQRLAAALVDSDVERLVREMQGDLDTWLAKLNSIASGKAGVTQMRTLLGMLKTGLGKFQVGDGAKGAGDTPPPKPAAPAKQQSSRQEEPDVKLSTLAKIYGLPDTASEDEVLRAAEGSAAARELTASAIRDIQFLKREREDEKVTRLLNEAVDAGRLKRWKSPGVDGELYGQIRTLARTDMRTAEGILASLPPFVDQNEYGAAGDQGEPPRLAITPGVARHLRQLGRDPATVNPKSLGEQWREQIEAKQLARAQKLGIPPRRPLGPIAS